MMTLKEYLEAPCRRLSIPYWKAMTVSVPSNMRIVHEEEMDVGLLAGYSDERYFRLKHDLKRIATPILSEGYMLDKGTDAELAAHLNACYPGMRLDADGVAGWRERHVYRGDLWLFIREKESGAAAASGIAEFDRESGEGSLEWIQVSAEHRRRGLGRYLVCELLRRMQGSAAFATVSGRIDNESDPEVLYRNCGFSGCDVWHVLTERL